MTKIIKNFANQDIIERFEINIIPDKSLLPKIGDSGHNFYEAVAEFIDNSIDAMTQEQRDGKEKLCINIIINAKKKFFSITDNGIGMDKETAIKAATLAKSDKTDRMLGKYGMGLQSGLMTISDNFIVTTALKGNEYKTEFEYDANNWSNNPDWKLPALSIRKNIDEHGTTIKINKVTKIQLSTHKTQYLKADIAKRYRSFIQSDLVKITVNNVIIVVENVDWTIGYPINFNIPTKYGEIYGKIGLMRESSQKGYYGFDIFRNGRMIITNSKFAIGEHPTTARICGEIHLNFVKVSHEKNKFITESIEYDTAEQACRNSEVFKQILKEARKKSEEGNNKKENFAIDKEIEADMPLIAQVLKTLEYDAPLNNGNGTVVSKSKRGLLEGLFDRLDGKKRKPYEKRPIPKSDYAKTPNNGGNNHGHLIELNGMIFKVNRTYLTDKNMGRKSFQYDNTEKILTVYINKAFAGFKQTKDKITYCRETVVDAVVSFLYKDHDIVLEKFNETKDDIMSGILKLGESLKTEEIQKENDELNEELSLNI